MPTIHYTACPACGSTSLRPAITAKDYTVSGEVFSIVECGDCTLRFTQDVPSQENIGKYYQSSAYISHTDTREGIINSVYHRVRNHTLEQKKKLIAGTIGKSSARLLDIGAGTGAFASYMQRGGWEVTALEPDAVTRRRAMEINKQILLPAENLYSLPKSSFYAITMWHVLEHVHTLHEYLAQISTLLADGGYLFIAVPNYTSEDARYYREFWAAYDVPRHLYHFSPASMRSLVEKHGLTVTDIKPMWFDSFYVSMLSEQYKNGKARNIYAFFEGLKSNLAAIQQQDKCSSLIYLIKKK
ncbi:MAG: class I SAM-dependent methyltransferase [Chitinophagaceae bacterium]